MKPEIRAKILAFNRARAKDKESAEDFMALLNALPPGQVKQLLKSDTCGAILRKYGITEEESV